MAVLKQIWTGFLLKYLTTADNNSFLQGIMDMSKYVSNVGDEAQAIHLVDMNVLPEVLVNNTTYPIDLQEMPESDVVVQLHKFQTLRTPITDDELYALTYDKMTNVRNRHGLAINIKKTMMAIHALAPANGSNAKMPVLVTTGEDDGTGRRRITWGDVGRLKTALDNAGFPEEGRRLVLCKDHENDFLATDEKFKDQFYNSTTGKLYNRFGFDLFAYSQCPYYNPDTKVKLSFGAVPSGTDRRATVFFSLDRAVMANGWVKMYWSKAENDTQNQRNEVNFRHNAIVLPTAEEARGAIISDNAA